MVNDTTSKTEERSHGGLYGAILEICGVPDKFYESTVTDENTGDRYTRLGSTPKEAERNASNEYKRNK